MNQRALLSILIGATALTVLPAMPRASAQETLTYFYYQPGSGGTRQPRTGTGPHFVTLAGPTTVGGALVSGSTVAVQTAMPTTWTTSGMPPAQYALAYVSITGGAGGGISVFPNAQGNLPLTVNVTLPTTPNPQIGVNAYYFPVGAPCPAGQTCGGGGSAAEIDEFSETQGTLLTDTFVNVYIPPSTTANAGLTGTGNMDGTVITTNNTVRINADQPTYVYPGTTPPTVTGEIFDRWVSSPGGTVSGNNLNVDKGTTVYALAFYHSSCPSDYYWNPSATVSQCTKVPTCPIAGDVWNPTTKTCVRGSGGCPSTCHFGCYLPYIGPQGQPIWNCKPAPGTCTHAGATNGCGANQYCSTPGPGGTDCNCLKCSPVM